VIYGQDWGIVTSRLSSWKSISNTSWL